METLGKIVCAVWVMGCFAFAFVRLGGADNTGGAAVVGPPVISDRDLPDMPRPVPGKPRAVSFYADPYGQFWIDGTANGTAFRFLVDTGASFITFNKDDARRLGIDVDRLTFSGWVSTAMGRFRTAPAILASLQVGPFVLRAVPVAVFDGGLGFPLLGMTFMRRLHVAIGNGVLTLSGEP